MRWFSDLFVVAFLFIGAALAQNLGPPGGGGGGSPTGSAGGCLSGTYPNPGLNISGCTPSGTLPVANGGTGDTGTAWTTYTASPACGTATFTVNSARSKSIGKSVFWEFDITITAIGTCTNALTVQTPSASASASGASGRETAVSGFAFFCDVPSANTQFSCSPVSGNYAVNDRLVAGGVYESQ